MNFRRNLDVKEEFKLCEYQSLRSEIQNMQNNRINILGFTIASIGTIIGSSLSNIDQEVIATKNIFPLFLLIVGFIIIVGACYLTLYLSKHIELIGCFIYNKIEKELEYQGWETFWNDNSDKIKTKFRPKGFIKRIGFYYLFISLLLFLMIVPCRIYLNPIKLTIVAVFFVISILLCFALIFHKRDAKTIFNVNKKKDRSTKVPDAFKTYIK